MEINKVAIENILREYPADGNTYQTSYQTGPGQNVNIEKKTYYDEQPGANQQQSYQYSYEPQKQEQVNYGASEPFKYDFGGVKNVTSYNYNPSTEYRYEGPSVVREEYVKPMDFGQSPVVRDEGVKIVVQDEGIRHSGYGGGPSTVVVREEGVKRSGLGVQSAPVQEYRYEGQAPAQNVEYKFESSPLKTDYKTTEIKTDFDKTGILPYDYRTGNFSTFEYKPVEYKPTEYKPTEYKASDYVSYQPQPQAYKVTEYVVNDYKPPVTDYKYEYKPEVVVDRSEGVKRAGVTTTTTEVININSSEEAQIRQMSEEIERIRALNIDSFNRLNRLRQEKSEILIRVERIESEMVIIRGGGGGDNRQLQLMIEDKNREIEILKSQIGNVRGDRTGEVDELNQKIKEKEREIDMLNEKIKTAENAKLKHLNELNANKEAFIKSKNNGTSWCC